MKTGHTNVNQVKATHDDTFLISLINETDRPEDSSHHSALPKPVRIMTGMEFWQYLDVTEPQE